MLEKLKDFDRKTLTIAVVVLLLVASFMFVGGDDPAPVAEETAQAQEAEVEGEENTEEGQPEEAPAEESAEESAEEPAQEETEPATEEEETSDNGNTYNYVAQSGDSYTKIARKAVQTYGIINGVELNQAQIVAAETKLTQAAGSIELSVGDEVTIDESAVKSAIEEAQNLDEAALAMWSTYVQYVDFNTDNVGEARE